MKAGNQNRQSKQAIKASNQSRQSKQAVKAGNQCKQPSEPRAGGCRSRAEESPNTGGFIPPLLVSPLDSHSHRHSKVRHLSLMGHNFPLLFAQDSGSEKCLFGARSPSVVGAPEFHHPTWQQVALLQGRPSAGGKDVLYLPSCTNPCTSLPSVWSADIQNTVACRRPTSRKLGARKTGVAKNGAHI